jgi:hypothetical protein
VGYDVRDRKSVREQVGLGSLEQNVADDSGAGLVDVQMVGLEDMDLPAPAEFGRRALVRTRRVGPIRLADREANVTGGRVLESDPCHVCRSSLE